MNLHPIIRCLLFSSVVLLISCNSNPAKTEVPKIRIEILDPEALSILDTTQKIETIAEGFNWTEGPLYINDGDYLLFSDIPENKIFKWKEGQGVTTYLQPSGNTGPPKDVKEPGSNGLILHPDGHLVLCQHGDRRVAKMTAPLSAPKPEFTTLADNYKGKHLNSPNDGTFHPNGDLYFTDPPYGLKGIDDSSKELDFQGIYRLKPNGRLDTISTSLRYPNGIALSPDLKYLYVASSDPQNYLWMRYELDENGLAKSQRVFYEAHAYEGPNFSPPDGLKINKMGYIFASAPEGICIFTQAGKLIARLYTGEITSNCAFTGDQKVLYMTCDHKIKRLKLKG